MRKSTVAALSLSSAMIFTGAAQATDGSLVKGSLDRSLAVTKSAGGLLIAQAGAPAPKSSSIKNPKAKKPAKKQAGNAKNNDLVGTKGLDVMSGGPGKDSFWFVYRPMDPGLDTLDNGDRITDYEFGELIDILGVHLTNDDIKLVYDAKKNETRLELDLPRVDDKGKPAGKDHRTIILSGDKRGEVFFNIPCCISRSTEIQIKKKEKPKTAKTTKKKAKKEATKKTRARRHHVKRSRVKRSRVKRSRVKRSRVKRHAIRIERNRYPNQGVNPMNGGE